MGDSWASPKLSHVIFATLHCSINGFKSDEMVYIQNIEATHSSSQRPSWRLAILLLPIKLPVSIRNPALLPRRVLSFLARRASEGKSRRLFRSGAKGGG
jgi:hypothetical protein